MESHDPLLMSSPATGLAAGFNPEYEASGVAAI
jgi:hypothetical protein